MELLKILGIIVASITGIIGLILGIRRLKQAMESSIWPLKMEILGKPHKAGDSTIEIPMRFIKVVDDSLTDFYIEILEGEYKSRKLEPSYYNRYWGKTSDSLGYKMPKGTHELNFPFMTYESNWIPVDKLDGLRLQIVIKLRLRKGLSIRKFHLHSIKKKFRFQNM
jgi:hypothetical protein